MQSGGPAFGHPWAEDRFPGPIEVLQMHTLHPQFFASLFGGSDSLFQVLNSVQTVVNFGSDAMAFKRYGYKFWKDQVDLDQEYRDTEKTEKTHTPELYAIWYEKKEFVLKAIELNPFNHSKFLWADAGGFRLPQWYSQLQNFALAEKVSDSKMFLLEIEPFHL